MDRALAEFSHAKDGLSGNVKTADGVRATRAEHLVEDCHADSRFGLLTREAGVPWARTNDGLASAHSDFNQAVIGLFLPAQPSSSCNGKNVPVSL